MRRTQHLAPTRLAWSALVALLLAASLTYAQSSAVPEPSTAAPAPSVAPTVSSAAAPLTSPAASPASTQPPSAVASPTSAPSASSSSPTSPSSLVVRVHHVPLNTAKNEEPLALLAIIEASHLAKEVLLYVRQRGAAQYERIVFQRMSTDAIQFSATVPAERVVPGVMEYYLASRGVHQAPADPEQLHFASPDRPHPVTVIGDEDARWRRDLLAQHFENRSRLQAHTEYVNFGTRDSKTGTVNDSYWRAELDYSYRFLGWVYSIRLGAGLLLGQTYVSSAGSLAQIPDPDRCALTNHSATDCRVGVYYGFAELRFRFGRFIRWDLRPILGVGPQSFDGGASTQLIIGHDPGTHVGIGVEGVSHIGVRGWLRLAWDTVPRIPMSFTIDLENFPNNDAMAMRLMMNFAYRFGRHFSVDLMAGYATRGWQIGGPTIGGGLVAEF